MTTLTKKEARGRFLVLMARHSPQRRKQEGMLVRRLLGSPEWAEAGTIALTLSMPDEIGTRPLVQAAWERGAHVVIPATFPGRRMEFFPYAPDTRLVRSRFGVLEPAVRDSPVPARDIDLLVVPGLAFTASGQRLGFGGGFYDRYLARSHPRSRTVSLALPFQMAPERLWTPEGTDIPIDRVLTL